MRYKLVNGIHEIIYKKNNQMYDTWINIKFAISSFCAWQWSHYMTYHLDGNCLIYKAI